MNCFMRSIAFAIIPAFFTVFCSANMPGQQAELSKSMQETQQAKQHLKKYVILDNKIIAMLIAPAALTFAIVSPSLGKLIVSSVKLILKDKNTHKKGSEKERLDNLKNEIIDKMEFNRDWPEMKNKLENTIEEKNEEIKKLGKILAEEQQKLAKQTKILEEKQRVLEGLRVKKQVLEDKLWLEERQLQKADDNYNKTKADLTDIENRIKNKEIEIKNLQEETKNIQNNITMTKAKITKIQSMLEK